MDKQWITEEDVAVITSIGLPTLRNNRNKKKGIPYYKVSKSVRYKQSDVLEYMEARKIGTEDGQVMK